jgi:hypothetical protein
MDGVAWMTTAEAVDVGIALIGVTVLIGFAFRLRIGRRSPWRVRWILQPA